MINFGTSAYLKILALNPRPGDTELRKRVTPSENGYDFHKAMRRIASRYAAREIDLPTVQAELANISRIPERKSATQAINQLTGWLGDRRASLPVGLERRFVSDNETFSVRFSPDIVLHSADRQTLIHLWNTQRPRLAAREAIGALGLFASMYEEHNIAVLCLRTRHLFEVTEATRSEELARLLSRDVERRIIRISGEVSDSDYMERDIVARS